MDLLHEVEVLDLARVAGAVFAAGPALALPALDPLAEAVDQIAAVRRIGKCVQVSTWYGNYRKN